jgi:zinc transport system ATP-binding protein
LDEPVSGLDPVATKELYNLVEALNREGVTILMISHDITAALRYANHILHIGEQVFFGTKQAYLQSDMGRRFALDGGNQDA